MLTLVTFSLCDIVAAQGCNINMKLLFFVAISFVSLFFPNNNFERFHTACFNSGENSVIAHRPAHRKRQTLTLNISVGFAYQNRLHKAPRDRTTAIQGRGLRPGLSGAVLHFGPVFGADTAAGRVALSPGTSNNDDGQGSDTDSRPTCGGFSPYITGFSRRPKKPVLHTNSSVTNADAQSTYCTATPS